MRQTPKRGLMEMIEMGVGQEHQIDRRQMLDLQTAALDAFEQEKPVRKIGINQDVEVGELDQKRSVADPSDADLAFSDLGKLRRHVFAGSFHEQRGNQNAGKKIAFMPIGPRTQPDASRMPPRCNRSIAVLRLANNVSPFLFRKADWHGLRTI